MPSKSNLCKKGRLKCYSIKYERKILFNMLYKQTSNFSLLKIIP